MLETITNKAPEKNEFAHKHKILFIIYYLLSNKEICILLRPLKPLTCSLLHSLPEPQDNHEAPEW